MKRNESVATLVLAPTCCRLIRPCDARCGAQHLKPPAVCRQSAVEGLHWYCALHCVRSMPYIEGVHFNARLPWRQMASASQSLNSFVPAMAPRDRAYKGAVQPCCLYQPVPSSTPVAPLACWCGTRGLDCLHACSTAYRGVAPRRTPNGQELPCRTTAVIQAKIRPCLVRAQDTSCAQQLSSLVKLLPRP